MHAAVSFYEIFVGIKMSTVAVHESFLVLEPDISQEPAHFSAAGHKVGMQDLYLLLTFIAVLLADG